MATSPSSRRAPKSLRRSFTTRAGALRYAAKIEARSVVHVDGKYVVCNPTPTRWKPERKWAFFGRARNGNLPTPKRKQSTGRGKRTRRTGTTNVS